MMKHITATGRNRTLRKSWTNSLRLSKARKSLINEFYDYYGDSSKESVENTLRRFYDVLKGK